MKGLTRSIEYLRGLIKKFNDRGDYHIGDELSWALDDLESAHKELETTKKQLAEAVEVIKFYGDPETYIKRYTLGWEPVNPGNDNEQILGYQHPGTDWRGTISPGGKRARQFLAKLSKEEGI